MVGTGPGSPESVSPRVLGVLKACDVVVGYKTYIDLISGVLGDKEKISTGMTREIDRCKKAIELAVEGKQVVLVSSGDPGVYGMAGLALEMLHAQGLLGRLAVEILPGHYLGHGSGCQIGRAADARFCRDKPKRPANPLGNHREKIGSGLRGGFRNGIIQSRQP